MLVPAPPGPPRKKSNCFWASAGVLQLSGIVRVCTGQARSKQELMDNPRLIELEIAFLW